MASPQVAPAATGPVSVQLPDWSEPFIARHARFKVIHGGRSSGKTWTVATLLLLIAMLRPMRIVCMREVQDTIGQSSKKVLEDMIDRYGWGRFWRVYNSVIRGNNGSEFTFRGMNNVTARNIRSLEGVNAIWFDEAQYMSRETAEQLYPTIRETPGMQVPPEIWVTFNPLYRTDAVWRDFCIDGRRKRQALVAQVNYLDNPWMPRDAEQERLNFLEDEPDRYEHVWLGRPDDEGAVRKVLPYALIRSCVDAWDGWAKDNNYDPRPRSRTDAGLDIADTGADRNALVARNASLIWHAERWMSSILGDTARRADGWGREHGIRRLYYDEGGIGAGIRSTLTEMARLHGARPYQARGVNFGGEVEGPDEEFSRNETNAQHFARRNSQLGWALHMRARRTQRLVKGATNVNPDHCLFIDRESVCAVRSDGRRLDLEEYLGQLSQPEWKENNSGRIVIEKQPKKMEGASAIAPSPDLYDASALAYSADSDEDKGLTARR